MQMARSPGAMQLWSASAPDLFYRQWEAVDLPRMDTAGEPGCGGLGIVAGRGRLLGRGAVL
jgi:hypothetical protein